MAGVRLAICLCAATLALALAGIARPVLHAQVPDAPSVETLPPPAAQSVIDVRVEGNDTISLQRIVPHIRSRAGRAFDPLMVEEDVRRLTKTRLFVTVDAQYQERPEGLVVIFRVVERPTIRYIKYVGHTIRRRTIDKQTNLKVGDAMDPYVIEEARRKLQEYYRSKGFSDAMVTIIEGDKAGDRGAVFLINEGQKQRIWHIEFVGNTIASDGRLKTQIESKLPLLYLFKGFVDRDKIDEDVQRLTAYYRSLGYFSARVGRELEYDEDRDWLTLTFVIDEGPRYQVRNVSFIGNGKFASEHLSSLLELHHGDYFDQRKMNLDVASLQDEYGAVGHIFAEVNADPRFLEEPGTLDLVYHIDEGARYRVGRIDVKINGDYPHTRRNVILNRLSLQPGDIVDTREIRDSERRLRASGLFLIDPTQGIEPKIALRLPEPGETVVAENEAAGGDNSFRGQSPDGPPDVPLVLTIDGALDPEAVEPESSGGLLPAWLNIFRRPQSPQPQNPPTAGPQHVPPAHPHQLSEQPTIRGQSPDAAASGYGYGAGQVPLGRTSPDAMSGHSAVQQAAVTAGQGQVVQAQYTAPGQYPPATQYPPGTQYPPPVQYGAPGGGYAAPNVPPTGNGMAPWTGGPPLPAGALPPGALPPPLGYDDPLQLRPEGDSPFLEEPLPEINVHPEVTETQTGRIMFGVGVNSDLGVLGTLMIDEQNFDWRQVPTSWADIRNGTAWRGDGQQFRAELVPGSTVSRYTINFREPYLFDTRVSLGLSGYFYTRLYEDWDEERLGGRVSLGYQFTPDLSGTVAFRGENVAITEPQIPTPPELAQVLGDNSLYSVEFGLVHDTRDSTFLATEGHRIGATFEQAFGDFDFPKVILEGSQYFMLRERIDGSGRHVLAVSSTVGFAGNHTPLFENFFAGGFTTLRGFRFREASPRNLGVTVGGEFEWINSVEYMFPVTADDMIRGVVFCDFGTVEADIELNSENFRVAPGAGLRITVPAMGPAPIALDIAAPIAHADGDRIQNFSFFVGFGR